MPVPKKKKPSSHRAIGVPASTKKEPLKRTFKDRVRHFGLNMYWGRKLKGKFKVTENHWTQAEQVKALYRMAEPTNKGAILHLTKVMRHRTLHPRVRGEAAFALSRIHDKRVIPLLKKIREESKTPREGDIYLHDDVEMWVDHYLPDSIEAAEAIDKEYELR